jgi:isopenicillin-N epimerase
MWSCGDEAIRNLWSLDSNTIFLNHGSYGGVPLKVREEYASIQSQIEKNPVKFLSRELPEKLMDTRRTIAQRLNADPEGFAFVSNATSGVGAVLASLPFTEGDEIVFHNHGYGWVRQGLQNLARSKGVVVREALIPMQPNGKSEIVSAFEKIIGKKTKLVVCDHVTSSTALIFPVQEIVELARSKGVPVLVDGAHAPGILDLDLQKTGADFYTGNFHKWVCAPRGSAFLSVAPQWRGVVRPLSLSYSGGVTHHLWDQSFVGYFDWTGTNDFAAWLAVPEAFRFHDNLGWQRIFSERKSLLLEGYRLYRDKIVCLEADICKTELLAAMVTLPLPQIENFAADPAGAKQLTRFIYEKFKIEIPAVCFDGKLYVRASAQIYNRLSDFERLADAIGEISGAY